MSSIFNLDVLTHNEVNTQNLLESSFIEESYFITTLEYLSEMKSEVRDCGLELHKNILESTSYEVVNESFANFFVKIKEIIERFLKFIKSLFDRFVLNLNKLIRADKYITKHKDLIRKFNSDHEFDIEGYYFTFDSNVPVINARAEFTKDFVELDFDMFKSGGDNKDYISYINSQAGKLNRELQNGYYDKFRGEVLGKENYEIPQSDFAEELFEIFRNGCTKKDTITIDVDNILASLSFFENYKEFEKSVKKTKDQIDKDYKQIERQLQGLVYRNKDNDIAKAIGIGISADYADNTREYIQASEEVYAKLNLFIKSKINQVIEMSNIHSMAFSYKLDAITDCYKQDKAILYRGIQEVLKDSKLRMEDK